MRRSSIVILIACLLGLLLLLYPKFSDQWNSKHTAEAINNYREAIDNIEEASYETVWKEAVSYNKALLSRSDEYALPEAMTARYLESLDVLGNGLIGYVEIPKIETDLPIFHTTGDAVLQFAAGHIEWSSLPTGGENTHCVLSGHRGLPSARLFTDLDELREGDLFMLNILNQTLTYEVDQIRTVLPDQVSDLGIVPGRDFCTLVTCTPYGINTHRLLVRGHRTENVLGDMRVISEAVVIDPMVVAPMLLFPILLILLFGVLLRRPKRKREMIEKWKEELKDRRRQL